MPDVTREEWLGALTLAAATGVLIMHRVLVFDEQRSRVGERWFRTMTEARAFAEEQCKRIGRESYTVASFPFRAVVDLLEPEA